MQLKKITTNHDHLQEKKHSPGASGIVHLLQNEFQVPLHSLVIHRFSSVNIPLQQEVFVNPLNPLAKINSVVSILSYRL